MKLLLTIIAFVPLSLIAQDNSFTFQDKEYIAKMEVTPNRFGSKDTTLIYFVDGNRMSRVELAVSLYAEEEFDSYQYWTRETVTVEKDAVIVMKYNYQTEYMRYLAEWERKTYKIDESGHLSINKLEFKYFGSEEWIADDPIIFDFDSK